MTKLCQFLRDFKNSFTAGKRSKFPAVKEFLKSVKNWQSYRHDFGVPLFWDTINVYVLVLESWVFILIHVSDTWHRSSCSCASLTVSTDILHIQLFILDKGLLPCPTVHGNSSPTLLVSPLTNTPTNRRRQKHKLLVGNSNSKCSIIHDTMIHDTAYLTRHRHIYTSTINTSLKRNPDYTFCIWQTIS